MAAAVLYYDCDCLVSMSRFITVSPPASPAYKATVPLFRWVTMRSGPSHHFGDKTVVPLNPCRLYFCRFGIFCYIWETLKSIADGMTALWHQYSWSLSICIFWLQQRLYCLCPSPSTLLWISQVPWSFGPETSSNFGEDSNSSVV